MSSSSKTLLKRGDVVYIPEKDVIFDQNTVNAFTVITGVVSVLLTAVLVSEQLKN